MFVVYDTFKLMKYTPLHCIIQQYFSFYSHIFLLLLLYVTGVIGNAKKKCRAVSNQL